MWLATQAVLGAWVVAEHLLQRRVRRQSVVGHDWTYYAVVGGVIAALASAFGLARVGATAIGGGRWVAGDRTGHRRGSPAVAARAGARNRDQGGSRPGLKVSRHGAVWSENSSTLRAGCTPGAGQFLLTLSEHLITLELPPSGGESATSRRFWPSGTSRRR